MFDEEVSDSILRLEFEFDDLVAFGFRPDQVFLLTREHHDTIHCHTDLDAWSERSLQGFLRAVRKSQDVSFYRISDLTVTRRDQGLALSIGDLEVIYDPGECEFSCQDQDLGDLEKTGFDMELVMRTGNQELVQDDGKVLTVVETGKKSSYDLDDVVQVISSSPEFTVLLRDGSIRKHEVSVSYDRCPDGFIQVSSGDQGDADDNFLFRADLVRISGFGDSFRFLIPGFEDHSYEFRLFQDPYDDAWRSILLPKDTHQVLRERGYGNLVDLEEADDEFYEHSVYANTEKDLLWVNFPMEGESRDERLCISEFSLSQILFLKHSKEEKRLTLYFRDGSQRSTETGLDLDIGALDCPFVSFGKKDADEAFWVHPEDIVLRGPGRKISVSLRDGTSLLEITPEMVSPYLRVSLGFMRLAEKNSPKWELASTGFDKYGILDIPAKDHHLLFRENKIDIRDMDALLFYGLDLGGKNTFVHMFSLRKGADKWKNLGTERREGLVDLFLGRGNPELRESFLREIRAACTRLKDNLCEVYVLYDPTRFSGVTENHRRDPIWIHLEGENPVEITDRPI